MSPSCGSVAIQNGDRRNCEPLKSERLEVEARTSHMATGRNWIKEQGLTSAYTSYTKKSLVLLGFMRC